MADNVRFNRLGWLRSRFMERARPDDQGIALIIVVILATVMSMIAAVIVTDSTAELRRSTIQVDKTSALQAAQAGIDDYTAKMTQDSLYYFHYVNQAEPQRTGFGAPGVVTAGTGTFTWTGINPWTYAASSPRRWVALGTQGFEYSPRSPPSVNDVAVTILATGRKVGDPNVSNWRDPDSSPREFRRDFRWWSPTTTPSGREQRRTVVSTHGTICHDGIATADLLAEVR
jgi:hypothetical protein